jgi:hypothetical protein
MTPDEREKFEQRARLRCKCRLCANLAGHPCGFVLTVAIPFAKSELARVREGRET